MDGWIDNYSSKALMSIVDYSLNVFRPPTPEHFHYIFRPGSPQITIHSLDPLCPSSLASLLSCPTHITLTGFPPGGPNSPPPLHCAEPFLTLRLAAKLHCRITLMHGSPSGPILSFNCGCSFKKENITSLQTSISPRDCALLLAEEALSSLYFPCFARCLPHSMNTICLLRGYVNKLTNDPAVYATLTLPTDGGWKVEKGGFRMSRTSQLRSTFLRSSLMDHMSCLEDWSLSHQMHHLSHLQWWFSIFLREINVIFWCTQVSLFFLSERIKVRGRRGRRKVASCLHRKENDNVTQEKRGRKGERRRKAHFLI